MDSWNPVWIGAAGAAVLLLLWWQQRRRARRRTEALLDSGIRLGLAPVEVDALQAEEALFALPLLQEGHSRSVSTALAGARGRSRIVAFDYSYVTGYGKSRETHRQTVAAVHEPGRNLPGFRLGPESIASRLGAFVGLQHIDFDGHPEFSKAYWLRARDEPAVRDLFAARALAFFGRERDWYVEGGGEWLLACRSGRSTRGGKPVPADQLGALLDSAVEISGLFSSVTRR